MEDQPTKLISEFNEAAFQIQRLNFIWISCTRFACEGNLKDWNWRLDRAYVELWNDMIDCDGQEQSEKKESFYQKFEKIKKDISKDKYDRSKFYGLLMEKEQLLRNLQEDAGKGGKKKNLDEDLMD